MTALKDRLKTFKKRYLKRWLTNLDGSATRIMTDSFLSEVLGYTELVEIKTEYRIRPEYADYVIQLKRIRDRVDFPKTKLRVRKKPAGEAKLQPTKPVVS